MVTPSNYARLGLSTTEKQNIIKWNNKYITEKVFFMINDFGDIKDFSLLERNLTNLALIKLLPSDLSEVFVSLNNDYNLTLNIGNPIANMLNIYTTRHPLGNFRDTIIKEYLTPCDYLLRSCPYCFTNYSFLRDKTFYDVKCLNFYVDTIALRETSYINCLECSDMLQIVREQEYIDILPLTQPIFRKNSRLSRNTELLRSGDVESNPGPTQFPNMIEQTLNMDDCKNIALAIPNIISYDEVMTKLKPINTLTSLFHIYKAPSIMDCLAEILRLLETHNLFWSLDTEKLITCIDCICSLIKNVRDVPDLISQIPGMDRNSQLPNTTNQFNNMEEQSIEIDEDGLMDKALKFAKDFGVDPDVVKKGGPIVALVSTAVAAIALIGCGSKINNLNITFGLSHLVHTMAMECKDWKILLGSLKDTWEYVASALGKFLGFTYIDEKTAVRKELITRLETLKTDIQDLEDKKELNYSIINDPAYFDSFQKRFKDLEKLLIDMIKTDQNLVSFRLVLDKLRTRLQTIKDDYVSLFNSKCGKQQPTTIYIGSDLSGIGKTTFMEWCIQPLSVKYGRALTKYVKGQEDYWSNYVYQDIVHWRDFNQKKTNEEHIELINIYDPSQTQLNMSDNDQKGRQFKSRFMFIDSNVLYVRRSAMIEDGKKLDRRRDFLFEAFTEYVGDASFPTPRSEQEAIDHLYLVSMPKVQNEALDLKYGPSTFKTEIFTVDGRVITRGGKKIETQKFDEIINRMYEHETRNNKIYLEKCQRIFDQEKQEKLMREETLVPAISTIDAEAKKVILLIGAPGTGKTTLARKFNGGIRQDENFKYDEFTVQNTTNQIRQYILNSYDTGTKDIILTANNVDYDPWIASLEPEARHAIERRCIKIEVKFMIKKNGWLRGYVTQPEYYTKEDVENEANSSLYSRMVGFYHDGINIKITGANDLIDQNIKKDIRNVISYDRTPRIKLNAEMARNLVEFDMYWRDVDEIKNMTLFQQMKLTKIIRTTIPMTQIMRAFSSIVTEVFQNYDLCEDLELGLNQLNSLRITAPLEFDCVIKLKDETFFLTTDDDGKIVFCMCDDSFEYKLTEAGNVSCYHNGEYLWQVEGRVANWYKHIQRNVDMVQIDYTNITPPSRDLVKYCDYFINFLKTGFAALAIKQLCSQTINIPLNEEMYDVYNQSFTRKPTSYQNEVFTNPRTNNNYEQTNYTNNSKFRLQQETSADAYLGKQHRQPAVQIRNTSKFKLRNETSADAYLHKQHVPTKVSIIKKSQFRFKQEVKHHTMENEACIDIQAAQLADIVMNQNYPLFINNNRVCYGQGVFNNYMVTVGHLAGQVQVKIDGVMYDTKVIASDSVRDLAIIKVITNKNSLFKDIRRYFQKERVNNSVNGFKAFLYCWSESGNIYEKPVTLREQKIMEIRGNKVKDGLLYSVNSLEGNHPIQTQAGFCGSPMIICNPSYPEKILGLHVAADDIHGLTSVVFKDDLYFTEMEEQSLEEQSIVVLPFQQAVIEEIELPNGLLAPLKCVGRAGNYLNDTFVPNKVYSSDKTQIYPSPFSTGDDAVFEPSILSEKDPRLEVPCENIIYNGLNKFAKEQHAINIELLDECFEELTDVLLEGIRRTGMRTKLLTMDEVINGCSYYTTSPSLNMSSGVGYPHSFECGGIGHKADAFHFDLDTCKYDFADNLAGKTVREDVESYLDYLKMNEGRTAVIYVAQKKDEVLKLKKIKECGTRIFEMGPLYHFMGMKMYYGAAQAMLTYVNSTIPFKIGINASSREFANLYKFLLRTGTNGMNCDYTGFDSSHPLLYLERYHKIYNRIYQETDPDWKQEDDDMRRRLHLQENKPLVLVDDLIIECPGGLMSGGEDTGGKNNIAGNINMRYAWKVLALKHCPNLLYKYDDYTTDATFGDDLIKTIHDDVLSWYNPENIQEVLASIGFTITSADKETKLTTQPLDELTFLKRNFNDLNVTINGTTITCKVGALEDNCFIKMVNWCKASKRYKYRRTQGIHYDPATIGLSALTCLSEASLKGKDFFNSLKKHLQACAREYSMVLPKLPTFEQAFYETYFCSNYPQVETKEIITLRPQHKLHPLSTIDFYFNGKPFVSIMHCYEYQRALCHQQAARAEEYYNNPSLCKYVYYPNNRRFSPDKLMRKIISVAFKNETFNITSNQKFVADYGHTYFGFQIGDAVTNKYGEILTEFAISKLPKENLNTENIENIIDNPNFHKILYPVSHENIIVDSDYLVEPELRFNTKTWTPMEETTHLCPK